MHAYICMHMHACICMHMHAYACIPMRAYACIHRHAYIQLTETILHHFAYACMHTMHTLHACIHTIHTHAKTSDALAKSSPDHRWGARSAPQAGLLWSGLDFGRVSQVFACTGACVCIVCMHACGVCMACMKCNVVPNYFRQQQNAVCFMCTIVRCTYYMKGISTTTCRYS